MPFIIDDLISGLLGFAAGSAEATMVTMATIGTGISVGMSVYQRGQVKKAESQSRKGAQAAAEAEGKAAARERAVQNAPITAKQMQKVINQRELQNIVDLYAERERNPRVYTLPTAQPSDPVVRLNQFIHNFLAGAA